MRVIFEILATNVIIVILMIALFQIGTWIIDKVDGYN